MTQQGSVSHSPHTQRVEIARNIVERKRLELGTHLIAAACYGSVAHHAAADHSDVELVLLTDDTIAAREDLFFEHGIMVECDMLPASRMLSASQRVTKQWGIEADQYRHHLVLWDPEDLFPRLWATAHDLPSAAFEHALKDSWWGTYETRNKHLNAQQEGNNARIRYGGWQFAFSTAMRIALYERRPYESGRTIWQDVTTRGYGMSKLVDILAVGAIEQIPAALDEVWEQTRLWGAPEGAIDNG